MTQWTSSQTNGQSDASVQESASGGACGSVDLITALASITDARTKEFAEAKAKAASKGGITSDKDVKAAIMAQYAQVSAASLLLLAMAS